jgi:hypothetical protein
MPYSTVPNKQTGCLFIFSKIHLYFSSHNKQRVVQILTTYYLPTYLPIVDFHEHLVHYQPFVHMNLLKTPPYLLAYVNFIMYTSTNVNLVLTV